jgi:O-antigen/teichoic acid export membrane protein
MSTLKQFLYGKDRAQMGMIGAAVGLLITLIIVILIYYNVSASIDTSSIDRKMGWNGSALDLTRPALNATNSINGQASTFFTIAPIIAIVIVAVVVIGYVQRIGG